MDSQVDLGKHQMGSMVQEHRNLKQFEANRTLGLYLSRWFSKTWVVLCASFLGSDHQCFPPKWGHIRDKLVCKGHFTPWTMKSDYERCRAQHFLRICTHAHTTPINNDLCPPMPTYSMTCAHLCPPKLFKLRPCIQKL